MSQEYFSQLTNLTAQALWQSLRKAVLKVCWEYSQFGAWTALLTMMSSRKSSGDGDGEVELISCSLDNTQIRRNLMKASVPPTLISSFLFIRM